MHILFQDHNVLVVNKPAGLVIHPTYKHANGTMWDDLLVYLTQQEDDGWHPPELPDEPGWEQAPEHIRTMLRAKRTERLWRQEGLLPRPCLLHRLDKDTSGLVVLARTERARRHFVRQFKERTIVKRYLALVHEGAPIWTYPRTTFTVTKRDETMATVPLHPPYALSSLPTGSELVLDGPLQRDPFDRRRCVVGPAGQSATTVLRVIATDGAFILLDVRLITGRTHQIRAHLATLGYPVIGDQTYALPPEEGLPQAAMQRQFLHAYCLELRRYPDNVLCTFTAPLPNDLAQWLEYHFPAGMEALHAGNIMVV